MNVEFIGLITLVLGTIALFAGPVFACLVFVPMTLLGSAGAVLLGGAGTIQPAHLMLGFVALCVFVQPAMPAAALRSVYFPQAGFWLLAFIAYAVTSAFFLPRIMAGFTDVNAIGSTDYGPSLMLVPLGPTSGNLTQSIYLLADFICFITIAAIASTDRGFRTLYTATLAYCIANVVFAAIDIVTAATDTGQALQFIRNADYQLHLDEAVVGLRRITGSFTEASAFAFATIASLGFTARLWLAGVRPRLTGTLSVISFVLLALSTSSTAYVATPLLMLLLYVGALIRMSKGVATRANFSFLWAAPLIVTVAALAIALNPVAMQTVANFLDVLLFDKSMSQSGLERAQWNASAIKNFSDTYWLGGGLGSIRASSFPLAVLSNTGAIGAVFLGLFLLSVLAVRRPPRRDPEEAAVQAAARISCVGLLIGASVSGALVDLGLLFYVVAALAAVRPATFAKESRAPSSRKFSRDAPPAPNPQMPSSLG